MHRGIVRPRYGAVVAIPRTLTRGKDLVVLTREAYERDILHSRDIAEALHIVAAGEQEYREGRTVKAASLEEALKLHAKRSH